MKEYKNLGQKYFEKVKKFKSLHSKLFMVTNILTLLLSCERTYLFRYRVFFIESGKLICYKILKILLFHDGFGFRTEVTMGYLISDQFKTHF